MPAPFDPLAVANRFLDLAQSAGQAIDPLKLQKLLYFAHGWCLALRDKPLIHGEIQAWRYGPVVDRVYQAFRHFGSQPIRGRARRYSIEDGKFVAKEYPPVPSEDPDAELIDAVWEEYGKFDGVQLFKLTHAEGTAWQQTHAAHKGELPQFVAIPQELIRTEFQEKLERAPAA